MNEYTVIDITGTEHIIKAERYDFIGTGEMEWVIFYTALNSVVARFHTSKLIGIAKGATA